MKTTTSLTSAALCTLMSLQAFGGNVNPNKPNIVFILTDDIAPSWYPPYAKRLKESDIEQLKAGIWARGYNKGKPLNLKKHIETASKAMPFLAKLADEGAVFQRAFSTAALCSPSRSGLLTGSFQQRWGGYKNVDIIKNDTPLDRLTIAQCLKKNGYTSAMIGKWHIGQKDKTIVEKIHKKNPKATWKIYDKYGYSSSCRKENNPLNRGFDYYLGYNRHGADYYESDLLWEGFKRVSKRPKGEFLTEMFNDKACDFVKKSLKANKPFFLYYAPKTLHGPLRNPPKKYSKQFNTGCDTSNKYAGHLLALDMGLERIYNEIKKHGAIENTVFVFSSDNGSPYPIPPESAPYMGGKGQGWLGSSRVPLIICMKNKIKSSFNTELVSLADIMPTLLELTNTPIPKNIDGKSMAPYLLGKSKHGARKTLWSAGLHGDCWSYCYETKGEKNRRTREKSPLYSWVIEGDYILLRITSIKSKMYKSLPNGMSDRMLLFNFIKDHKQKNDISAKYPEKVRRLNNIMHKELQKSQAPTIYQVKDFKQLLQETKKYL